MAKRSKRSRRGQVSKSSSRPKSDQPGASDNPRRTASHDRWARFRNRVVPWFGLSLSLMCVVLALLLYVGPRRTVEHQLSISAGSPSGLRTRFIDLLAARFDATVRPSESKSRLRLKFVPVETSGSIDSLRRVNAGELDLAFVQGGLPVGEYDSVRQVALLHLEPLHLLVKESLYLMAREHLGVLRGKTINLSSPGSGTRLLSQHVLRFVRLDEDDYQETNLDYDQLIRLSKDGEGGDTSLPDAVFAVSTLPSPVAAHLITELDYRIVPLPLSAPIRRLWLANFMNVGGQIDRDIARALRRIDRFEIPALTYQIDPPRPAETTETIGTRMSLVAGQHVSEHVVAEIVQTIYETDFVRATEQRIRWDELTELAEFPLHQGTQLYLSGKQPIATRQVIEVTEQLVGIFGAMLGAGLFLWQWLRRMRSRRKDAEFVSCIDRVVKIENEALSYEDDEHAPIAKLQAMQEELSEIKSNLIDRYRDGFLEGAETLSSFLKHASDASELISRIILHRMKN